MKTFAHPVTNEIYLKRLKALAWKMLLHYEGINERKWEHHDTVEYQESCWRCSARSFNYWRWSNKWWELTKLIKKQETRESEVAK